MSRPRAVDEFGAIRERQLELAEERLRGGRAGIRAQGTQHQHCDYCPLADAAACALKCAEERLAWRARQL